MTAEEPPAIPTRDEFAAVVDTDFAVRVHDPDTDTVRDVALTLVDVTDAVEQGPFINWSLTFHGPADTLFEQGTPTLRHESLGELAPFLVPIGVDGDTAIYHSSFSVSA